MISSIVAVDQNWAIGKTNKETGKGELLFRLPKDLEWFKDYTLHKIVVMGYTTYLSLPKRPLKDRINVVLWDQATSLDCLEGCITFNNFNTLLNFIQIISKEIEVVICGGASIYNLFLPYYDKVLVTKVETAADTAEVYFPNLDKESNFIMVKKTSKRCDGINDQYITSVNYYLRKKTV